MVVAVDNDDINALKKILEEVNNKNPIICQLGDNSTPLSLLHYAAYKGKVKSYKEFSGGLTDKNPPLLSNDAFNKMTPLHFAARQGHIELVKAITNMESGDKNPKDASGVTPLHLAALYGHLDIVEHLCTFVQDVNIKDNYNQTPLHSASRQGKLEVVQFLIGKKADPKLKANNGSTAYDLAIKYKHSAVADYLRQFN